MFGAQSGRQANRGFPPPSSLPATSADNPLFVARAPRDTSMGDRYVLSSQISSGEFAVEGLSGRLRGRFIGHVQSSNLAVRSRDCLGATRTGAARTRQPSPECSLDRTQSSTTLDSAARPDHRGEVAG